MGRWGGLGADGFRLSGCPRLRRPYNPNRLGNPALARAKKERFLRRQAEQLGFVLTPVEGEVS